MFGPRSFDSSGCSVFVSCSSCRFDRDQNHLRLRLTSVCVWSTRHVLLRLFVSCNITAFHRKQKAFVVTTNRFRYYEFVLLNVDCFRVTCSVILILWFTPVTELRLQRLFVHLFCLQYSMCLTSLSGIVQVIRQMFTENSGCSKLCKFYWVHMLQDIIDASGVVLRKQLPLYILRPIQRKTYDEESFFSKNVYAVFHLGNNLFALMVFYPGK